MGQQSSLSVAGVQGGVVLGQDKPVVESLTAATGDEKYAVEDEIARGGMGAILKAVDRDIRRPVAMKVMLGEADERKRARFVEEAQVTGQLEHPNIVPIHELGVDSDGRLFFTMKLVKGRSLEQVLKAMKNGGEGMSLGALLNAFVNVCNAVAFAHSKGVLHRDLKPANIMLGDYGEVLVMDWGLAKIIGAAGEREIAPSGQPPAAAPEPETGDSPDSKLHRIVSSFRQESGVEKTMDGTVVGTPVYMPPEQASGEISRLDQRSDIYSLGAILYEILTLKPPVEGKTIYVLLNNVVTGNITPPEQRTPERLIAKELSAVAMKALATKPENRYQTVEELRRDIELFVEGRAVSAKPDTAWETVVKLVKRNRTASVVAASAFVLLSLGGGVAAWINYESRQRAEEERRTALVEKKKAEENFTAYKEEQAGRRAQAKKSIPAFLSAARLSVNELKLDAALPHLDVVLEYDPENADARLLRGQVRVGTDDYAGAVADLSEYLKARPDDANARKLSDLCRTARPGNPEHAAAFADIFTRQKMWALSQKIVGSAQNVGRSREKQLELYRKPIEAAWRGLGGFLGMDNDGNCVLDLRGHKQVRDLSPLKGLLLKTASFMETSVSDLAPLAGMPLTALNLNACGGVTDLAPLAGMKLTSLELGGARVADLTPLKGMPLTTLSLYNCARVKDLTPLAGMQLTSLELHGCQGIADFSPLKGMPLKRLSIDGTQFSDGMILEDMPLTSLDLNGCAQLKDFSFLRKLQLNELHMRLSAFRDLTLVRHMPLTALQIGFTGVQDLGPLAGMKLAVLAADGCGNVDDLQPLKGMPLESLSVNSTKVWDLEPLRGMPLSSTSALSEASSSCRGQSIQQGSAKSTGQF
ncbi:MAG: protein kinase [Planctomycetota bacterium]|nr:protein kinase [Planctomycetota bacterium]